jgi:hypothetical protein
MTLYQEVCHLVRVRKSTEHKKLVDIQLTTSKSCACGCLNLILQTWMGVKSYRRKVC